MDPYEVLVSEVMLQQTRITTVLDRGFYDGFLRRFPTVDALAAADDETLLKAWEGLGYYRRARMLRDTARTVVERHGGCFPESVNELMALPGIGRYTAGALRAFAFGLPAVLVDGNVVRVLARLMDERGNVHDGPGMKQMWGWAEELADARDPRSYHAALMELGQTYCRPVAPRCGQCPVARFCATQTPEAVPVRKQRAQPESIEEHVVWRRDPQGRVLLHREQGARRTGLWRLPRRELDEWDGGHPLLRIQYAITRYRVELCVWEASLASWHAAEREGDRWFSPDEVAGLAMSAPFRRVVSRLLKDC